MFISLASVPDPQDIWAKWGSVTEGFQGVLFLHFGRELVVSLSEMELLELDKVIAAAFDDGPLSLDKATEKAQQ